MAVNQAFRLALKLAREGKHVKLQRIAGLWEVIELDSTDRIK